MADFEKLVSDSRRSDFSTEDIWSLNATVPESVDACVHAFIKRTVWDAPASQAVCSWDGDLTYRQLDELSSCLAHHLIELRLRVGDYVLLALEKSFISPVAVLAVMKAGGVSIALQNAPSQPVGLSESVSFSTVLCLSTPGNLSELKDAGLKNVLTLDSSLLLRLSTKPRSSRLPVISPVDYLFATFGATSELPTLALVTHGQFSSAIVYQQRWLGLSRDTRTLDYLPYSSPLAWCYLLHTLSCGGCICITSPLDDSAISVPGEASGNANCAFVRQIGLGAYVSTAYQL
jgi:non-ribosomal peptide synthetase component F